METKIGLVIGGNKGIGKALVAALADHWGATGKVYFTARREADAVAAQRDVEQATGQSVDWFLFDLANADDPERVSRALRERHGGLDVMFQNGAYLARAGVAASEDARPMIEANSHGSLRVMTAFLPLLRPDGHMIIVASALGLLEYLPEHLRDAFNTRTHGAAEINAAIDGYVDAVETGRAAELGWPEWVNIPSKVAQVAVTRAFAREARETAQLPAGATINAACPGVTLTDATREYMGTVFKAEDAQTPEAAAAGLMKMLAPSDAACRPNGELIQHGEIIPFGD